jgi:hypothetical protein
MHTIAVVVKRFLIVTMIATVFLGRSDSSLNVIAHRMGSLLARLSYRNVVMLGMGIFILWMLPRRDPNVEFTYYRSTKPFPNQRFACVVSYIAGIVLLLGGLWGLWLDWRVGR